MSSREIVNAVRACYPKFSKAALSLARRSAETGVTFTARAAEIVASVEGSQRPQEKRKEYRRKSINFRCRLSPVDAGLVKHEMTRRGANQQDLLEALLVEWARWSEKEPLPVGKTENGSGGGDDGQPAPSSEDITKS